MYNALCLTILASLWRNVAYNFSYPIIFVKIFTSLGPGAYALSLMELDPSKKVSVDGTDLSSKYYRI